MVRVRRGAYVRGADLAGRRRDERLALARVAALTRQLRTEYWFSHTTAALLWGCDLLHTPNLTHLIQCHRAGSRRDVAVARHFVDLPEAHRDVRAGLPVTSLERTVVDSLALLPPTHGIVLADAALRIGARPDEIGEQIGRRAGGRGIAVARAVWARAHGAAESPGESLLRWIVVDAGLPDPEVQHAIATRLGTFRVDLAWPRWRLVLEFDGRVKYDGTYGDGPAALWAEKRRQDALTEAGWRVLRITWADLRRPEVLVRRVADARRTALRDVAG